MARAAAPVEKQVTRQEPLDAPVWAALTSGNRALAEGGPRAKCYLPDVAPFGAIADRSDASFASLVKLVARNGRVVLETMDALVPPSGLTVEMQKPILQMVLETAQVSVPPGPDYVDLRQSDVAEMMDLAARTKPGPFGPRTIELGRYIGFRFDGVLAAMAGERMRFDRFVEISAVCVDPAYRGKGYAACLMMQLARAIRERDLIPFLHVFEDNEGAIALYKKLGFVIRERFFVTSLRSASI
ncbi:GNAT family N-acetyltransferase [Nguyenibacter vanlangensis]|uniref:GNAT family N-acetyltransferase n=1 Tax=Nguyenibacter vanlangensis TaxID=1216886 RepID=A0ABZ3D2Z1_9PROT